MTWHEKCSTTQKCSTRASVMPTAKRKSFGTKILFQNKRKKTCARLVFCHLLDMENKTKMTPRTNARAVFPSCNDSNDTSHPQGTHVDADFARALERELAALAAERDQLRAALALGQQNCDDAYDDLRAERAAAIARAESAEREAFDWKKIARYETARAERAEAELATERARLDWLLQDDVTRFDTSYHDRAAIDAAMKEET